MVSNIFDSIKCKSCGSDSLFYDSTATYEAYNIIFDSNPNIVFNIVDDFMLHFLVFKCVNCGAEHRISMSEVEKEIRNDLLNKMINMEGMKYRKNKSPINISKVFVYCGKCSGFDGLGSCPIAYYNDCLLKRLPIE